MPFFFFFNVVLPIKLLKKATWMRSWLAEKNSPNSLQNRGVKIQLFFEGGLYYPLTLRENKEEKHVLPLKQPETQLLPWTCQKGSYFSNLDLPLEHSYVYYLVRKTSDFPIKFSMCLSSSLVAA